MEMAVESHYRNHSDSKSESSSDKWNNSEILAHFKRSNQNNLRDAMKGYGMCIDYTSKRIESVSNAILARIREQQPAPNVSIISKITRIGIT